MTRKRSTTCRLCLVAGGPIMFHSASAGSGGPGVSHEDTSYLLSASGHC